MTSYQIPPVKWQTVQTLIRLLLLEQSDLGFHYLLLQLTLVPIFVVYQNDNNISASKVTYQLDIFFTDSKDTKLSGY